MRKILAVAISLALVASVPAYGQAVQRADDVKEGSGKVKYDNIFLKPVSVKDKKKKPPPPKPPKCEKPTKKKPSPTNPCPKSSSLEQGNAIVTVGLDRKIFFG